jgi:hypothetical protein
VKGTTAASARRRRQKALLLDLAVPPLVLAAGMLLGASFADFLFTLPIPGAGPAVPAVARSTDRPPRASVAGPLVQVLPDGGLLLTWRVTNLSGQPWDASTYRFIPQAGPLPILALPHPLAPRETVTLRVALPLPDGPGERQWLWQLWGPAGPVEGGVLTADVGSAGN